MMPVHVGGRSVDSGKLHYSTEFPFPPLPVFRCSTCSSQKAVAETVAKAGLSKRREVSFASSNGRVRPGPTLTNPTPSPTIPAQKQSRKPAPWSFILSYHSNVALSHVSNCLSTSTHVCTALCGSGAQPAQSSAQTLCLACFLSGGTTATEFITFHPNHSLHPALLLYRLRLSGSRGAKPDRYNLRPSTLRRYRL
jgi:hypothetical protein